MSMRGLVKDALDGHLAITPLAAVEAVAAGTVTSAGKTVGSLPLAVVGVLTTLSCPAAHTLDVIIEGRNADADAWETVGTFTQVTNADIAIRRVEIETPMKQYRCAATAAGAFGGAGIPYTVHIVGTNVHFAPITQVD